MPTVPPTYISLDHSHGLPSIDVIPDSGFDSASSPTPDPDLDDGMLVPVTTGDGVGAITSVSFILSLFFSLEGLIVNCLP